MTRNTVRTRAGRVAGVITASAVLAALAAGCGTHPGNRASGPGSSQGGSATPDVPGQVQVQAPGVDLTITDAVEHIASSGSGTLTMSVHNGGDAPEHLAMVATPDGGRGVLSGVGSAGGAGSLTTAGILIPQNTTVTFGGSGPAVRLPAVHVAAGAHTLPLALEFGLARLVHLTVRVSAA